uniref:Sec-independent periplasmic protein translocase n=1 Tax=Bulboplastis apyrenoidosa TaxID=1070855 RepID=A0A1Y9TM60_9RHOD|nr:sec-independent periplasmic protein translocase [Bulboplastis apyrenoidosa]ARO90727.1 sec-independent periplasmic protein translocase [Bulboplastis apyrenoidosa]
MNRLLFMSNKMKMPISVHLEELRGRLISIVIVFVLMVILSTVNINQIIQFLQLPAEGIKFLQLAPGEYFFTAFKVSLFFSVILTAPFSIYQIMAFVIPGLTKNETKFVIIFSILSLFLFGIGILFCYTVLMPITIHFFIQYGSNIIEPLWSFEQYFNFIVILLLSTGLIFELPILQVLLNLFNIVSFEQMCSIWKYVIFFSTIIGAILTPSTDPLTQLLFSLSFYALYILGLCGNGIDINVITK